MDEQYRRKLKEEIERFYDPEICRDDEIYEDMSIYERVIKAVNCGQACDDTGEPIDFSVFTGRGLYNIEVFSSLGFFIGPVMQCPAEPEHISMWLAHALIDPDVSSKLGISGKSRDFAP